MQRKQLFTRDLTILVVGQVISLFGNAVLRFHFFYCFVHFFIFQKITHEILL